MTKDEIKETLRGRLRCIYSTANNGCSNVANAGGRAAGYMALGRGSACRLMGEVARGAMCSSCGYACRRWVNELSECRDDGEIREVLKKACVGWTPTPSTNRIPGEAEP